MIAIWPCRPGKLVGRPGTVRQDHGMDPVEIHEAGVLLRPWRPGDAAAVFEACQDPEIQRWTSVPRPYLREHAEGFVTAHTERAWAAGTSAPLGVFDPTTGELLGSSGLISLEAIGGTAEIGFWTAPTARERGVATRAARGVARWAFEVLGLRRLVWRAEVGNHASRVVAVRLGMRMEGVQRRGIARADGTWTDGWAAGLLRGELREAPDPVDLAGQLIIERAGAFGRAQPVLTALTPAGVAVRLRRPAGRDLDAIVAACRDRESAAWTTVPDPYQHRDAEYFTFEHAPGQWARGEGITCAITDADDAYCGSIELRFLADPSVADVGYLVAPWARGRGFASTALRELCRWALDNLALRRIEWRAYLGNDASRRVAEKAGFTIEGVARAGCAQRGRLHDAWVASLLPGDL
jgi:RimJ/RimL family protein N-acetyltransferase